MFIEQQISVLIELRKKKKQLPSNLRNRTGEGRKPQILCDKRDNNFAWKNIPPNFSFLLTDLFVKDQKTLMSITTKHALNSPVTFVTHKRFAALFFLQHKESPDRNREVV